MKSSVALAMVDIFDLRLVADMVLTGYSSLIGEHTRGMLPYFNQHARFLFG